MLIQRANEVNDQIYQASSLLLRPYQVEVLARSSDQNLLANLAPGLGKTALAAATIRSQSPVLIIVPRVARGVWLKDLYRFGGVKSVVELRGMRKLRAVRRHLGPYGVQGEEPVEGELYDDCLLVTHECVGSWVSTMPSRMGGLTMRSESIQLPPVTLPSQFAYTVIDESHRFGSKGSKRSVGMAKLAQRAGRVLLLSGTPDMGGVHRLWFQFNLLHPGRFGNYYDFIVRYAGAEETKYGLQPTRGTNLDELAQISNPYVISYRQEEVAPYLPTNTRSRYLVEVKAADATRLGNRLEAAAKSLAAIGESATERSSHFLPGEVVEARKACAEIKIQPVAEEVEDLVKGGERVVIWCWHKDIVHQLSMALAKRKVKAWSVTGDTIEAEGDAKINRWSRETGALIATIARLGEGEDRLVAAAWQIFLEVDWLPQTVQQAERRLVRLSQTRPVNTRFFQLDIPFERSMLDRILVRAEDTDTLLGATSRQDIGSLFGEKQTGDLDEVLTRLSERCC